MTKVRAIALAAALSGCASSEGAGDASPSAEDARALAAQMADQYDQALTHRCDCLVEQGLVYDSVESCLARLGWDPSGEDCMASALEEHGTDKLRSALRCHVGHLRVANACADAVSCEELLIEGACDETSAMNPCGQDAIDLFAFVFEHCPQLDLHARQ